MAEAFIQAGELADALEMLDVHLAANPGDDAARRLRAAARSRLGGADNMLAGVADLDALSNRTANDEVQRSILLMQLNDDTGARGALARAHELAPDDERITERYIDVVDVAEARKLVDTLPKTWGWLKKAGDLAIKADDHAAAVDRYTAALERLDSLAPLNSFLASQQALLRLARAHAAFALGRYPEAGNDFAAAEAVFPNDVLITLQHGLAVFLSGDADTGTSLCRRALAQAGQSPQQVEQVWRVLHSDPRCSALSQRL
jgi:tetratricopeptide (TPR) repeat protein